MYGVYVIPTIYSCGITCCVLALPQRNMFYSKPGLVKGSIMCAKKVVPKLDSKSVPSACEAGALPSELLGSVELLIIIMF